MASRLSWRSGLLAETLFPSCSSKNTGTTRNNRSRAGGHARKKIREQLGNKCCQTPSKTVYHDIGKGKKRQPHSVLKSHLQAGGRRFDPGHVHQPLSFQCDAVGGF